MLLEARLSVRYRQTLVLRDLALVIKPGKIVGLAGQSGSGKSTLALALLRLLQWKNALAEGSLKLEGCELLSAPESEWRQIRGRKIALVMQSAESALNPALRLRRQLQLAWQIHASSWKQTGLSLARELFNRCSLPGSDEFLERYPAQISIGQAQRVLIAMALLHRPALLVADELTSALDLLTQQEVLQTLREVNQAYGTAILFCLARSVGAAIDLQPDRHPRRRIERRRPADAGALRASPQCLHAQADSGTAGFILALG